MAKTILQLHLNTSNPTVVQVRKLLGLRRGQIDAKFGVRPVRGDAFAVRVDADVAGRVRAARRQWPGNDRRSGDARVALIH